MKTILNYKAERSALFGLKRTTNNVTVLGPETKLDAYKPYHICVAMSNGTEQKVHTSFTLEEAKALIKYEREEDDAPVDAAAAAVFGDYASHFRWIVKNTKEGTTYTYNPATRSLDLNLA
jgi:hypothetical protein